MKRHPILLSLLVLAVTVFGSGIAAAQMRAGDRPTVRGPLRFDDKSCARDVDSTTSGQTAVVTKGCTFTYDFRKAKDRSARRDFGVFWFQTTVDPRNGFCLTDVRGRIWVPRGYRIEGHAPKHVRTTSSRRYTSKLIARGGGMRDAAVVKNSFKLRPRVLDPDRTRRRLVVDWRGSTRKTFALAMGIEVSYRAGNPPNRSAQEVENSELRSRC